MKPRNVDARSVVFIRHTAIGFEEIESGWLSHDGETLTLRGEHGERQFGKDELAQLRPVAAGNHIAACQGFDFFVLIDNR